MQWVGAERKVIYLTENKQNGPRQTYLYISASINFQYGSRGLLTGNNIVY